MMKKGFQNYVTFENVIRWWLTGILLFLPFQYRIVKNIELWNVQVASFIRRLDEITIIIFLLLAIIELYKNKEIFNSLYLILLFPFFFLSIAGFLSGIINGNSLLITFLGTFNYIKSFLVIFIFAAFIRDISEFKKIFRLLLIVAVFIGLVAFIQEFWAIYSRFIKEDLVGVNWRMGIYRASSLMAHYNVLGMYCLLILTIYLFMIKKANFIIVLSLLSGIFTSVSRTAYMGFVILSGVQIFKGKRWLIIFLIPIVIGLFFMSPLDDFNISKLIEEGMATSYNNITSYREYAGHNALNVWKDHPLWGVGPGMFGGAVAFKYRSPLYEEYNFTFILNWFHSLDQLWPQALAEMGIVGAAALASLFISLLIILFILRHRATSDELRGLFTGLLTFTIIFIIYTFGGNLNMASLLFPFCAFIGMGLGCVGQSHLLKANEIRREE
jgi:hypothetical protein